MGGESAVYTLGRAPDGRCAFQCLTLTPRQHRHLDWKENTLPQFVSIGRFAQLARLTPRALRLYDELGLLTPALVEPGNGYRLYRLDQVATARMIRTLRDLGVPLEDIRAYGQAETPAAGRAVLERHRERLERLLASTQDKLTELGALLQEVPVEYRVNLRTEPPRLVLALREYVVLPETGGVLKRAMDEVCALLGRRGVSPAGDPWCAYPLPEEGELVPVDCVVPVSAQLPGEGRIVFEELPGMEVAQTTHVGPYSELPRAFEAVATWIAERGLEIAGPLREVYVEHDEGPAQQHVVDVVFPVRSKS